MSSTRDRVLEIIAIDRANDHERAATFISDNQLPYIFLDNGTSDEDELGSKCFRKLGFFQLPIFLDGEGKIRNVHIGFNAGDEAGFENELKEILK